MSGMSPRIGVLVALRILLDWMRPARKFVSPSLSRMVDSIVRVANVGWRCPPNSTSAPRFETSTVSLRVTSRLWCTRGSMATLMPTSLYWYEV